MARINVFHCELGEMICLTDYTLTEPSDSALSICSFASNLLNMVGLGTEVSVNPVQRSNS